MKQVPISISHTDVPASRILAMSWKTLFYFLPMFYEWHPKGTRAPLLWAPESESAINWCPYLAAVGALAEVRECPLSHSASMPATGRSVSSLKSMPNAFAMFWIQLHKLWTGMEAVLALRMLQQHMILLHKVPPICPGRFSTLAFLWSTLKLTEI